MSNARSFLASAHLAPNIKDNWDETVTIASISKEPYYDEEGYKMQNVTLSFE